MGSRDSSQEMQRINKLYSGLLWLYGKINRKPGRYSTNFNPYPSQRDQQARMIAALPVQLGRASTAAVQSNPISPAKSQSTRNTRLSNRSWSSSLFCTGLMLLFMFLSITATEGFKDWSEITHQIYTPNCRALNFGQRLRALSFGQRQSQ